jgi:hypothetical protein
MTLPAPAAHETRACRRARTARGRSGGTCHQGDCRAPCAVVKHKPSIRAGRNYSGQTSYSDALARHSTVGRGGARVLPVGEQSNPSNSPWQLARLKKSLRSDGGHQARRSVFQSGRRSPLINLS